LADPESQVTTSPEAPEGQAPSSSVGDEGRVSVLSGRYTALMSPVVHALERALRACQSCEPETPAERRFVQEVRQAQQGVLSTCCPAVILHRQT
jgi:hypothetical protein